MADRLDAACGDSARFGERGAGGALREPRVKDAFGLIDEAMLPVLADEVPIEWAGDIYCLVLHRCHRLAGAGPACGHRHSR